MWRAGWKTIQWHRTSLSALQRYVWEQFQSTEVGQLSSETLQCWVADLSTLLFQPQELIVEGCDIYRADMMVTWKTRIIRPPIVSQFDIKTRGRVITYDSGEVPSVGNIQTFFIGMKR
jgi:hypothetical protein